MLKRERTRRQPAPDTIKDLLPVIVGGDIGAYAMGLEMFEAFGLRSICVASSPVAAIKHSNLFGVHHMRRHPTDEELVDTILGVGRLNPDRKILVLTNNDRTIRAVTGQRERFGPQFLLPYPNELVVARLSDKESFNKLAASVGVLTPTTTVVDMEGSEKPEWQPPDIEADFPVVAKPAVQSEYEQLTFEGKQKVWFIDTPKQLDNLWDTLIAAGFRGRFLVQQNIPGDDTYLRSLTFYVDSGGEPTLRAGARVLLQDPTPLMVGNPVAMITDPLNDLAEQGQRILGAAAYSGFANFDVKISADTGEPYFLEANPRVGRNSYYVAGAGVNPLQVMVDDLYFHQQRGLSVGWKRVLYSLVPLPIIRRYVENPFLVAEAEGLAGVGLVVDPLTSPYETSHKRWLNIQAQRLNWWRKFG